MADEPTPAESPPPNGDAAPPEGSSSNAANPSAKRLAAARPWQGGRFNAASGRRGPSGRLRTILILLAVILALAGAITALAFYLTAPPRPYFVAIAIDQYHDEQRIPVNRWTAQDRDALRGRDWRGSSAFDSQQRDRLVAELRDLGRSPPADQPLVIYLSAYALPAVDGGLAVLPGDANLDDDGSWLPLQEVFGMLKSCPVQRKLLLLDVAQPFADARAGALANDAAFCAEPVVRKAVEDDPTLMVLCACSPGQTSLASEEMGHTVFVHYLLEGLAGKADGWPNGSRDNRVTARELAAFTSDKVDHWAQHNRGARQTPVLLAPDGADIVLASYDPAAAPPADAPLAAAYLPGLQGAWEARDGWKTGIRLPTPPALFRQFEDDAWWRSALTYQLLAPPALYRELEEDALHAEDHWRGGASGDDVQAALKEQTGKLESRRKAGPGASVRGEPRSLALAAALGRKPPAREAVQEAISQLRQLADWQRRAVATPPDPDAVAKLEPNKKAFLKDYEGKPFELAWVVFRAAGEHPEAGPAAFRFWVGLLRPEGKAPPDYAELHILDALAALEVKDSAKEWPADAVGAAMKLTEGAELAHAELTLCPPTAAPLGEWLRNWTAEADDRRQAKADLLLSAKPEDRGKAAAPLDEALTDDRGYEKLRATVRVLAAALRCRDDALTLTPGYAAYLEHEPERERDWQDAVGQTRALRDRLAQPLADGPTPQWLRETETKTQELRRRLDSLLQPANTRLHALVSPNPKADAADAENMRALLRLPALTARDRIDLWDAWRKLAGRLNDESISEPDGTPVEALHPPEADKAAADERNWALLRARASLALLNLYGADVTKLEADLDKARNVADDAALGALSRELRASWKRLRENHGH